ncbi:catalase family peroxidase [Sulfurovum sp. zt1-1]|uniref:Catalase-related peroxidase n=1 Tax=Sulfurovum zhangzhouensis TaxID=3019067 RepID=A0ABT7QYB5_9BACT|nr:catalase family peroxidase [Sulfurovum zhangzhouensis]MDM5271833.1 catalase family peroxidase [Sulfurovum zhangzhouensis]
MSIKKNNLPTWLLSGMLTLAAPLCMAAEKEVTADQVVSALESTFGVHSGERRNHIKGTCATGEFVGSPEANTYTRSILFSGKPVSVIARFSLPGGNPEIPDTAKVPRGMALEFRLPDGSLQHMTMLNTPVFGAASPQTFLDNIIAKKPDPATGKPDPEKIKAFKASHPDSLPQSEFLAKNNPPVSWTNSSYFGIHTFKFVNRDNKTTLVRWRFVPKDGEKQMTDDELKSSPPKFLEQKLIERTISGPVQWDMILTIGIPGDPEDNPTLSWPSDRKEIKVGTLTITSAMPQKGAECEKINFDPLVMTDGIEPTSDPVLLFRSSAYAISFGKRLSGN